MAPLCFCGRQAEKAFLEVDPDAELSQTLLTLSRVTCKCPCALESGVVDHDDLVDGLSRIVRIRNLNGLVREASAVVRGRILRIEEVEDLSDHFDAVVTVDLELLREPDIELGERTAAQ